jgi:hypothetical protein
MANKEYNGRIVEFREFWNDVECRNKFLVVLEFDEYPEFIGKQTISVKIK